MKRTVILAILDGWGIGRKDNSNPIYIQNPKNIEYIKANFPSGALQASGIAVGLPWGEEGNSEVGHLTLGAGKIIYQHFPRITLAIRDGSFFKNPAFLGAAEHVKKNGSSLHLAGLLTAGNVHASLDHIAALIKLAAENGVKNLYFHLFTDGKDSPPKSAPELLKKIGDIAVQHGNGKIASLSGRYYALDRDEHWDRTEKTYKAMTGETAAAKDPLSAVEATHKRNLSDEFVEPAAFETAGAIKDGDALIFCDFREDSIRQIAEAFIDQNFARFPVKKFADFYVATMTRYREKFAVPVAFPPETVDNPLGKVLSDAGKSQLRIAETEKYAHVTYFFNGFKDQPLNNEFRVLIPSKNVPRYDDYPEMMAKEITDRAIQSVEESAFDFILINYANADIVAHTGNYDAALKAIAAVDGQIGRLLQAVLAQNAVLIITSDHGNAERMIDPMTAMIETKHDTSPVPVYVVAKELARPRDKFDAEQAEKMTAGILSDIAPTVLDFLGVPKPPAMTGESLLRVLT
ncbi:MAG: 2,3-bisphosphoglycerate-independent phosphoglycerate mutase [Parcubacteria group bacterium]|nr:2,3-bisphosphoglycerate-independent phosphoglycerate mutase [Parcubacteria group bacterium]